MAEALQPLGMEPGDRMETPGLERPPPLRALLWRHRHRCDLHTINLRLFPDQIAWMVNHAEDPFLFFDLNLQPVVEMG